MVWQRIFQCCDVTVKYSISLKCTVTPMSNYQVNSIKIFKLVTRVHPSKLQCDWKITMLWLKIKIEYIYSKKGLYD